MPLPTPVFLLRRLPETLPQSSGLASTPVGPLGGVLNRPGPVTFYTEFGSSVSAPVGPGPDLSRSNSAPFVAAFGPLDPNLYGDGPTPQPTSDIIAVMPRTCLDTQEPTN